MERRENTQLARPYQDIAKEYQPQYDDEILLVGINGKLRELHKTVQFDCSLHFFTGKDQPGIQTYHRSAIFLMLKAFYDVAGSENIEKGDRGFFPWKRLLYSASWNSTSYRRIIKSCDGADERIC